MPKVMKAPADVIALIEDLKTRYEPLLVVRVGCLMVEDLMDGKRPVSSKVVVNSLSDRLEGKPDITIKLDADDWRMAGFMVVDVNARRRAIVDSALYSIEVEVNGKGQPKLDAADRPLCSIRFPDWHIAGFFDMAWRHGEHSVEVIEARRFREAYGQLCFWFDDKNDLATRSQALIGDTLAALISVGHTEEQANLAIARVLSRAEKPFKSVAELVEAVYSAGGADSAGVVGRIFDEVANQVNAGALGPDVTATVSGPTRRKPAKAREGAATAAAKS